MDAEDPEEISTVTVEKPTTAPTMAELTVRAEALESAADMVVITNTNGVIKYVNAAFCNETGYSKDEVIGANPRTLKSGRQNTQFYSDLWATINSGSAWSGVLINRRKDGSEYPEEMTITPVKNDSGEPTHFIAIKRNISDKQAMMEAQAKSLEIVNELQEQKQITQARSEFLSLVSHELRTPLTSITAFTDILRKNKLGNLTDKQLDFFERIIGSARSLSQIVDDLVDMSKANANNLSIHLGKFGVNEFLKECIAHLQPIFDAKSQTLVIINPHESISLDADRHRIEQIVTNLLENASKYSADGTLITIEIDVVNNQLSISITDQGIGIDQKDLQHVFTPFFRANNPETRKQSGSGLGLYIVKAIVDLHHGSVNISPANNPDHQGTKVEVRIPQVQNSPLISHPEIN